MKRNGFLLLLCTLVFSACNLISQTIPNLDSLFNKYKRKRPFAINYRAIYLPVNTTDEYYAISHGFSIGISGYKKLDDFHELEVTPTIGVLHITSICPFWSPYGSPNIFSDNNIKDVFYQLPVAINYKLNPSKVGGFKIKGGIGINYFPLHQTKQATLEVIDYYKIINYVTPITYIKYIKYKGNLKLNNELSVFLTAGVKYDIPFKNKNAISFGLNYNLNLGTKDWYRMDFSSYRINEKGLVELNSTGTSRSSGSTLDFTLSLRFNTKTGKVNKVLDKIEKNNALASGVKTNKIKPFVILNLGYFFNPQIGISINRNSYSIGPRFRPFIRHFYPGLTANYRYDLTPPYKKVFKTYFSVGLVHAKYKTAQLEGKNYDLSLAYVVGINFLKRFEFNFGVGAGSNYYVSKEKIFDNNGVYVGSNQRKSIYFGPRVNVGLKFKFR